jgi:trk system potassium uptake protein TrkA
MFLVLVGGGNVGIQLAKKLMAREHEVLLVEKSAETSRYLAAHLGSANVLNGDACDLRVQKEAGFPRADVVVAVTGEDEDNLIVCQLAKEVWKVKRVLARVNDPEHEQIFRDLGIDDTVSATSLIFNLLEQQISSDELVPVGALHRGHVEVVESVLSNRSTLVGRKVKDLQLPQGTFLVYIVRNGEGTPVDGETVMLENDMIVALVPISRAEELRQCLGCH